MFGIALLLFVQLAASAYACPAASTGAHPSAAMPGCDEMDGTAPLCLPHCDSQPTLDSHASPGVPAAALLGFATWTDSPGESAAAFRTPHDARGVPRPEPPLTLRNCCLRI